jgi:manganese efflux pump family protein
LVLLSVATSIDALAVGLSFAMINTPILVPALTIGVVTAGLTMAGMFLGRRIGRLWGPRVEGAGGVVLIAIGTKIVAQHML